MMESGDGFSVDYFTPPDHRQCLLQLDALNADNFVDIELPLRGRELPGEKQFDSLVAKARDGDYRSEMIPSLRSETRLFAQFALSTLKRRFSPVAAAGRNFMQPAANRMAILSQHRDRTVVIERDHRAGPGMANYGKVDSYAVGQSGILHANIDYTQFQYRAALGSHGLRML